jgi:hypothetical protein
MSRAATPSPTLPLRTQSSSALPATAPPSLRHCPTGAPCLLEPCTGGQGRAFGRLSYRTPLPLPWPARQAAVRTGELAAGRYCHAWVEPCAARYCPDKPRQCHRRLQQQPWPRVLVVTPLWAAPGRAMPLLGCARGPRWPRCCHLPPAPPHLAGGGSPPPSLALYEERRPKDLGFKLE